MDTYSYIFRAIRTPLALTAQQQYNLGSPISFFRIPPKAPTMDESEAAETLLSLFSVRHESPALEIEDYDMDIDLEIQAPTPAHLSVTTAPDTPILPFLIPGHLSSSSGLLIEDYDMDIESEIQAPTTPSGFRVSTAPDTPFIVPPSSSSWAEHQDSASNDQIEPENEINVPRLRKERTTKVRTMLAALEDLRKARISVMDLLLTILCGESSEFYSHRLAILCDSERIRKLLDIIWAEKKSRPAMESWVQEA